MNKVSRLETLLARLLPATAIILVIAGLSGCGNNNHDDGGKPPTSFNADTVANHVISIGDARMLTSTFKASLDTFNRTCAGFSGQFEIWIWRRIPFRCVYGAFGGT